MYCNVLKKTFSNDGNLQWPSLLNFRAAEKWSLDLGRKDGKLDLEGGQWSSFSKKKFNTFTLCTSKSSGEQILEVNCSEQRWSKRSRKNVVIVMWHCIFSHVEFRLFTWTKTNFNYEIWKVKEKKLVSFKFLNILLTNTISDQRTGIRIKSCSGKERDYNISWTCWFCCAPVNFLGFFHMIFFWKLALE